MREDVFEQRLKLNQSKLKEAEARAELAERSVQKLQGEVDRLEGMPPFFASFSLFQPLHDTTFTFSADELTGEREKSHLLQEEVETTLKDLSAI